MTNLIQSDVFFFISSVSYIIITVLLIVVIFYVISILKDFKSISKTLKNGVKSAGENIEELAKMVRESSLFQFIFGGVKKSRKKDKK